MIYERGLLLKHQNTTGLPMLEAALWFQKTPKKLLVHKKFCRIAGLE
jgi:hypothetical protein